MRFLIRILNVMIAVLIILITVFITLQALDRHLAISNFDAYEHLARISLVWLVFLGYAVGLHGNSNIRIELFEHFLSPLAAVVLRVLMDVLMLALALVINVKGWTVYEIGSTQTIMGTPFTQGTVYLAIQVGTLLISLVLIQRIFASTVELFTGRRSKASS